MASPGGSDLHTPSPLGVAPSSAGKLSKDDSLVNYRAGARGDGLCGGCRYFSGGSCSVVEGPIRASMTCDLWQPEETETEQATETFRGLGGSLTRGRGPGGKRTHAQSYYTGGVHGPSILNPAVYDALRRKGMSKADAAAISNGQLNKKTIGGKWYKKGRHSSGRSAKMSESETFSTPGRARALRALGAARRRNTERVARGEKPIVAGKKVNKIPGLTKTKAKQRVKQPRQTTPKGEGPSGFTEPRLSLQEFFDKTAYMKDYNARKGGGGGRMTVGQANAARHGLTKKGQREVRAGAQAKRALPGLLKNRGTLKGRTKALQAISKIRAARSMMANTQVTNAIGVMQGTASRRETAAYRTGMRASNKAARASTRATRSKMGLSNRRSEEASAKSRYHSEPYVTLQQFGDAAVLESFFDKKAYMATYNKNRYGSKKASLGRRKATSGLGRLNRSKKITPSNPSKASTARIARLGMKRGLVSPSSSKTGLKSFVRGFAKSRKAQMQVKQLAGPAGVGRVRKARQAAGYTEQFFDKKAYMKTYNARRRGGGGGGGGSSLARVRGQASTPSAFRVRAKSSAPKKPRMVTRKGGLNPRARGPRTLGKKKSNPFMMRPGQGQHVPNKYGGGGPD
jgi:hypothetical protein